MRIYKIASDIFLVDVGVIGYDFNYVKFKIGTDYWVYNLNKDDIKKVKSIARKSNGKALNYAKDKKIGNGLLVEKDFPALGSKVIREEGEKKLEQVELNFED